MILFKNRIILCVMFSRLGKNPKNMNPDFYRILSNILKLLINYILIESVADLYFHVLSLQKLKSDWTVVVLLISSNILRTSSRLVFAFTSLCCSSSEILCMLLV